MAGDTSPAQASNSQYLEPAPLAPALLDRYLRFIGVERPGGPTTEALAELQLAHLRAIPFESFDVLLGRPIRLDYEALSAKLLSGTRGGYCFEQNLLLAAALVALGYRVRLHTGRMLMDASEPRPRTHLALQVALPSGEEWHVDVGFGRATLSAPRPVAAGVVSRVGPDRYRLMEQGGGWAIESSRDNGPWISLYLLDPRPVYPVDLEVANHYVATHPESYFAQNAAALRATAAGKRTLRGRSLMIDEPGRELAREITVEELPEVLRAEFGIVLPEPLAVLPG